MPKILTDADLDEMENQAAFDEFELEFKRSRRGNRWRLYEGATVTVFEHPDTFFSWCISDSKGTRYSSSGYEDPDGALIALGYELEVCKR